MSDDLELRRKRALWRASHRGTKELDLLIGGYASAQLASMTERQLEDFEAMLNEPEPMLQGWLLSPATPADVTPDLQTIVSDIRRFHGL